MSRLVLLLTCLHVLPFVAAAEVPLTPEDLATTIHQQLGINGHEAFHTPEGRPIRIVKDGRIIRELLSTADTTRQP